MRGLDFAGRFIRWSVAPELRRSFGAPMPGGERLGVYLFLQPGLPPALGENEWVGRAPLLRGMGGMRGVTSLGQLLGERVHHVLTRVEGRADVGGGGTTSELSREIDLDEIALPWLRAAIGFHDFLGRICRVRPTTGCSGKRKFENRSPRNAKETEATDLHIHQHLRRCGDIFFKEPIHRVPPFRCIRDHKFQQ